MERMTNCKRIHMMNCEELAQFLLDKFVDNCCDGCPAYNKICSNNSDHFYIFNCQEQMVKWLESEAE